MDTIKKLAELALGTRLKRLSDRLTKDVSKLYNKLNIDFEAKWFSVLYSIKEKSPIAITEVAANLGISHTAVKQIAEELIKKHYITSTKGKDERQRLLSLTRNGKEIAKKLDPVWKVIKEANKELLDQTAPEFLSFIEKIEDELDNFSIYERVWLKINGSLPGELSIVEYSPKMKKYFKKLNYEWLEKYFTVEEKDKNLLLHPKEKIIDNDGIILFALLDDEVVGTCALLKHSDCKYELAKMAVTEKYQGRKIGSRLLQEAINRTREMNADALFLMTNEKLIAANKLYANFGFTRVDDNSFDGNTYKRKTYTMKLNLIEQIY